MVNLSLARQLFARDLYSYGISAYYYWSDSIAAALLMEGLAKHLGLDAEDAYTLGILHAIGRILINRVVEEKGFSIYWDGRQPIEDWERGAVGVNFTEAGAMLLERRTPLCGSRALPLRPFCRSFLPAATIFNEPCKPLN